MSIIMIGLLEGVESDVKGRLTAPRRTCPATAGLGSGARPATCVKVAGKRRKCGRSSVNSLLSPSPSCFVSFFISSFHLLPVSFADHFLFVSALSFLPSRPNPRRRDWPTHMFSRPTKGRSAITWNHQNPKTDHYSGLNTHLIGALSFFRVALCFTRVGFFFLARFYWRPKLRRASSFQVLVFGTVVFQIVGLPSLADFVRSCRVLRFFSGFVIKMNGWSAYN